VLRPQPLDGSLSVDSFIRTARVGSTGRQDSTRATQTGVKRRRVCVYYAFRSYSAGSATKEPSSSERSDAYGTNDLLRSQVCRSFDEVLDTLALWQAIMIEQGWT
jgi:hypothetical protein